MLLRLRLYQPHNLYFYKLSNDNKARTCEIEATKYGDEMMYGSITSKNMQLR
jgi:hypothetical protein